MADESDFCGDCDEASGLFGERPYCMAFFQTDLCPCSTAIIDRIADALGCTRGAVVEEMLTAALAHDKRLYAAAYPNSGPHPLQCKHPSIHVNFTYTSLPDWAQEASNE